MNCFATRLLPGSDLKKEIFDFFKSKNISSGVILSSVGSLKQAHLRFSDQKMGTLLTGPFEILSLNGTLSLEGVHLHLCISDNKGQTFGGHLLESCLIHTTCELVIAEIHGHTFNRESDPQTKYMELKIK
jgi:predicted DNA-binding protein with PD1-like motif